MTDHPIIFSDPMVRALLDGRKTMTRRLAWRQVADKLAGEKIDVPTSWQRVRTGNRLWVREAIRRDTGGWHYSAEYPDRQRQIIQLDRNHPSVAAMIAWAHHKERDSAPSIHMPRWASRLTLVVTATKIERLHEISYVDALAEGMPDFGSLTPVGNMGPVDSETMDDCARRLRWPQRWFADLWRNLHGAESWSANPEIVALSFAVHRSNIDAMPKDKAA